MLPLWCLHRLMPQKRHKLCIRHKKKRHSKNNFFLEVNDGAIFCSAPAPQKTRLSALPRRGAPFGKAERLRRCSNPLSEPAGIFNFRRFQQSSCPFCKQSNKLIFARNQFSNRSIIA